MLSLLENNTRLKVLLLLFFGGCIIGWIYEEIFYFVTENWIGNRGFLYGPYLPVYGIGTILMTLFLQNFKKHPIILFLLAMLITGILEYITGILLWQIWQKRWWDYTGLFMNFQGYVCLRSVVTFGIGGLALIYVIEPLTIRLVASFKNKTVSYLCIGSALIMIIDLLITLLIRY